MSDLISRQALRHAMYHEAFEKDSNDQRWDSGCWIRYRMFDKIVESMPSLQEDDLISRQAAIAAITEIDDGCNMDIYTDEVKEILRDLPSPARIERK